MGIIVRGLCEILRRAWLQPPAGGQRQKQAWMYVSQLSREAVSIEVDSNTYVRLLQECTRHKSMDLGTKVHAHIIKSGIEHNAIVWNNVVMMYSKLGSLHNARLVFDEMPIRNVFSWSAMMGAYSREGYCKEVLTLFNQMLREGVKPDNFVFPCVLRACAGLAALHQGKQIHCYGIRSAIEWDAVIENALVDMYSKCGSIDDARQLFDKMSERDVFAWSAMISGYANLGFGEEALKLFDSMLSQSLKPNSVTIVGIIPACCSAVSSSDKGKAIHGYVLKSGFESDAFVGSALVDMYGKCQSIDYARQVFDEMFHRDLVSWNAMIAGYAQNGNTDECLKLLGLMEVAGMKPNSITIASVLPVLDSLPTLQQCKVVHDFIVRRGFESHPSVANALLDLYMKLGSVEDAYHVFDKISRRDAVSWNLMIAGYSRNGYFAQALEFFKKMQLAGVKPSVITWNAIITGYSQNGRYEDALKFFSEMQLSGIKPNSTSLANLLLACANKVALQQGKQIQNHMIKGGYESDIFVVNALLNFYIKCGRIDSARQVFDTMSQTDVISWNAMITSYAQSGFIDESIELFHQMQLEGVQSNVISWTAMISGYAQDGQSNEALELFRQMQLEGVTPNSVTIASVLPACTQLGGLQQGKEIHGYMLKIEPELDVFVGNSLIDMYAKCGSIQDAYHVFNQMAVRDVVSWNAMIAGYAMHGYGKEALFIFHQMQQADMSPDNITFIGVLSACSHAGLVDEGWQHFHSMSKDFHIEPNSKHYACMVDLLGRSGNFNEVQDMINKMPVEPSASLWGALLGACNIYCNVELGKLAAERLFELEPQNPGNYVLLSNIYAATGRWDEVAHVRQMMRDIELKKSPGCSWIDVKNRAHAFVRGDIILSKGGNECHVAEFA